ncbi:hypothetical protein CcaverHIS002_0102020 [Cutaneotrichosporon cavernicola]|uniref:Uncharacterized protein n=1 Tax=Cutaneotrichosporon cavernicola TaxID=279322 RepID=A0AA48I0V8_9TREE|nr:uncharacterized protein CcaverHIS019_0101970 [Cutaneotrichosporon cavernicola]BEI79673.1 hypothetical protein CcaverHIS002_0102020 [Cutaneotrichosporon cavernicola]BEI87479.1 hypothetical protein CcaverHIS019_0101970 [Cutaneotrichosporon cavernicola]BEI95250.1 hypothetical protein CcaverHIS631_0101990 [Cutaneotrichosporon cavernicola]
MMPMPMPVAVAAAAPVLRPPSFSIKTSPKANMAALGVVTGDPLTVRRSRPPQPKQQSRASTDPRASFAPPMDQSQYKSNSVPAPFPTSRHQPTNSASNLPAIAGLADAGPYPTTQLQMRQSGGGLGLPALPALPGAGPSGGLQIPQGMKPGEEICLECMMRDRDLADVDVVGHGVWERASDVALEELKSREYDVLRSMSIDHSVSLSAMSVDESISSSTHGETLSSPRSHTSGGASDDAARKKNQARDARRQRREDRDIQVARIGWRGFKWEEGSGGDGFPAGFRGTRPGPLTEKGIKNVMTMFPSSSALRAQILQSYLRGQYRLIVELRQEAHRLGQYPEPEELTYPPSPTLDSHDSVLSGSMVAQRTARVSMERGAPSIKTPSISTARSAPVTMQQPVPRLRESPSTPAGLNSGIKARPRTHYDREPTSAASRLSTATNIRPAPALGLGTSPSNRTSHLKAPSGSTGPKGRESKFYAGDDWSDTEDLWPGYDELGSPASTNLRPFSFAVRAGQQREREGSIGSHHRRSFFGKFGDSVTSFFTGSHGGSGSMIDMHLGIDMDRRNRTSSYQVHESPRVSAFIPSRPSYSGRRSFLGQPYDDPLAPPAVLQERPRAMSVTATHQPTARLTQVSTYASENVDDEVSPKKKGGIKGLIQKMKKGSNKKDRRQSLSAAAAADENSTSDLVPPPPMNFLVNRGERNHDRKRSSSSISMVNDSQGSLAPGSQGQRSVSAPLGSSASDISPTSSRFQPDKPTDLPRRSTAPAVELPPGAAEAGYNARRGSLMGSTMEMLTGSSHNGVAPPIVTPDLPVVFDEPQPLRETMVPNTNGPSHHPAYAGKGNMQPSLSSRYAGSTTTMPAIETPESGNTVNSYLSPASQLNTSPNRHKNLPPLPPGMIPNHGSPNMGSPEMYSDADALSMRGSMYDNKRLSSMPYPRASLSAEPPTNYRTGVPPSTDYFPTASPRYHQPAHGNQSPGPMVSESPNSTGSRSSTSTPFQQWNGGFVPQQRVIQPRASFDVLADNRSARVRRSTAVPGMGIPMDSGRNAQSMYIQQSAAASTGSFGRFLKGDPRVPGGPPPPHVANMVASSVAPTEDRKERRRGIKSIFGKK